MHRDFTDESSHVGPRLIADGARHVFLLGKVELGFEQRPRAHQPPAPGFVERPEAAGRLCIGLPALRLGLGKHQVGKALDLGKVHPVVGECAPGELARLGGTEAG